MTTRKAQAEIRSPQRAAPFEVSFAETQDPRSQIKLMSLSDLSSRPFERMTCRDAVVPDPVRAGWSAQDLAKSHRVRFHVLLLIQSGNAEQAVDFESVSLRRHDLYTLRPGQIHAFLNFDSVQGHLLIFSPAFCKTLSAVPSIAESLSLVFNHGPRLGLSERSGELMNRWCEELRDDITPQPAGYGQMRTALSFALLLSRLSGLDDLSTGRSERPLPKPRLLVEFSALLEQNFICHQEPAWYAKELGVSLRTLDRGLQMHGTTCKQQINERLVAETKRLLANPDIQVKTIAYSLGFVEPSNFSRWFTQRCSMSPVSFRSRMLPRHRHANCSLFANAPQSVSDYDNRIVVADIDSD